MMTWDSLKEGDLIFTLAKSGYSAGGHVAMLYQYHFKPIHSRFFHAINDENYLGVYTTKMVPSTVLASKHLHYQVIRCTDAELLTNTLQIVRSWMQYLIPFDKTQVEDLRSYYENQKIDLIVKDLRQRFVNQVYQSQLAAFKLKKFLPPVFQACSEEFKGMICNATIMWPFQIASYPEVPAGFQLDANRTCPTLLFNALTQDITRFKCLGELSFDYYEMHWQKQLSEKERLSQKNRETHYLPNWKAQVTGESHPEANMVREVLFKYWLSTSRHQNFKSDPHNKNEEQSQKIVIR